MQDKVCLHILCLVLVMNATGLDGRENSLWWIYDTFISEKFNSDKRLIQSHNYSLCVPVNITTGKIILTGKRDWNDRETDEKEKGHIYSRMCGFVNGMWSRRLDGWLNLFIKRNHNFAFYSIGYHSLRWARSYIGI